MSGRAVKGLEHLMRNWTLRRLSRPFLLTCLATAIALPISAKLLPAEADPSDWTTRDTWQHPREVMDALELKSGSAVADVGCGNGYFTFRLADRVGATGKVYAVDIMADRIQKVRERAAAKKLPQIVAVVGDPDDPHLPPNSLDAILVVNAYHEFRAYDAMLGHFLAALKPGGRLVVIDYIAEPGKPRSEYMDHHRIPPELVQQEVGRDGFQLIRREEDISIPGGSRNLFFLIFARPQRDGALDNVTNFAECMLTRRSSNANLSVGSEAARVSCTRDIAMKRCTAAVSNAAKGRVA
jgi:predicted methyltransferase